MKYLAKTPIHIHEKVCLVYFRSYFFNRIFDPGTDDENLALERKRLRFLIAAFAGLIFIPLTLSNLFKKIK